MKTQTVPPPCPKCGARETIPVVYGYPGPEVAEAEKRGEVILGGCLVGDESPDFICGRCRAPLPWVRSDDEADG